MANLHLTLLEKVGVRLDSFADSQGKVVANVVSIQQRDAEMNTKFEKLGTFATPRGEAARPAER